MAEVANICSNRCFCPFDSIFRRPTVIEFISAWEDYLRILIDDGRVDFFDRIVDLIEEGPDDKESNTQNNFTSLFEGFVSLAVTGNATQLREELASSSSSLSPFTVGNQVQLLENAFLVSYNDRAEDERPFNVTFIFLELLR